MRHLELLAPARDRLIGIAAIDCGADAVYIAGPRFGARQAAGNEMEEIRQLCEYAHRFGARIFVTLNTIIYDGELEDESFFYSSSGSVRAHKPHMFEEVFKKSIPTATFERAIDKHYFLEQATWVPSFGLEHAGIGAYHIEYDYPGNPDYPTVREGISIMNPPILK